MFRIIVIFTLIYCFDLVAQTNSDSFLFYNLENCFDSFDDSLNNGDNQYLPESQKHWTFKRYKTKLNNLSKVILASNRWDSPTLVGVCEVENSSVLKHLIYWTGLSEVNYQFIHYESPDHRGIDVALLFRSDRFSVINSKPIFVHLGGNSSTRDILLVKGVLNVNNEDTLFVLVNHWPSRYGGATASEPKRILASNKLLSVVDSIRQLNKNNQIIIMGDFNDTPHDLSVQRISSHGFKNMAMEISKQNGVGTNKYRYQWEVIDQIIVSENFFEKYHTEFDVIDYDFLLEDDKTYMGRKPFRSYSGPRYLGGFSDHLPVLLKIQRKN